MFSIDEISNGQYIKTFHAATLEEARADVLTLKRTGAGHTFSIQNESGLVVDVIKMPALQQKGWLEK